MTCGCACGPLFLCGTQCSDVCENVLVRLWWATKPYRSMGCRRVTATLVRSLCRVMRTHDFFHKSPSLLICDSMHAHLTDTVKNQVKQTNLELAIILDGLTKELQPLDIGVNRSFKVKLRTAWEHWMAHSSRQGGNIGRVTPLSAKGSWMPGLRYQSQVSSELSQRPESSLNITAWLNC